MPRVMCILFTAALCVPDLADAATNQRFGERIDWNTEGASTAVCTGDFNGDGKIDLAVSTGNAGSPSSTRHVSILLNLGGGTFDAPVIYDLGSPVKYVHTADLNGDGKLDLATVNLTIPGSISVLPNNGDGTFGNRADYVVGDFPRAVVSADFSGDGKLDLVVVNQGVLDTIYHGGTFSVLINLGDGTFAPAVTRPTGRFPYHLCSADFNGDGKPDLALANTGGYPGLGSAVAVLINNGSGGFLDESLYAVAQSPDAVTSADLNGDGKLDLAVGEMPGGLAILKGKGDGTFSDAFEYRLGKGASSVVAADFDGDNSIDLALSNDIDNRLALLANLGNGNFALPVYHVAGGWPECIDAADFDGDGNKDLVTANEGNQTVSTFKNVIHACIGATGNVDCDQSETVDIADLSSLIDNLYISLSPLTCPGEANIDGSDGIDMSDLTALIDYLYISYVAPPLCQ